MFILDVLQGLRVMQMVLGRADVILQEFNRRNYREKIEVFLHC